MYLNLALQRSGLFTMRKPDPMVLGRRLIRGHMYWLLIACKFLSLIPYFQATAEYALVSFTCIMQRRTLSTCRTTSLFPAVWCLVSAYMAYLSLDGLMVRWIVTYSQVAAVVRMAACVLINFLVVHVLTHFNGTDTIELQIWILISCLLTVSYILQSFVASNMATGTKERTLNVFHFAVYAVIPIGVASFLTMIGLVRTVMLLQYQLEHEK